MTAGLQASVVAQQSKPLKDIVEEKRELLAKGELPPNPTAAEMKALRAKLDKIEAKEKCLRVQFLDWLSDKLLDWSNRVHIMAVKIESPCIIEIAPRKKEDSRSAKESNEIARLHELLKKERERNKGL